MQMATKDDKQFSIGMVVSCKRSDCAPAESECAKCVENFVGENIKRHEKFSLSQITTGNQTKQFAISFIAHCLRPDCSVDPNNFGSCCTASSEKCEMCLRMIVGRGIREMFGFHAKEIAVV